MSSLSYSSIEPNVCKESFSKTFINSGDLSLLHNFGKDIHKKYLMFEFSTDILVFGVVLVDKTINNRRSTLGDLIETLQNKLGEDYKNAYYSKDDSRFFFEDQKNKEMDLEQFAFLNLNPSHSFQGDADNKIYRFSVEKNYTRPLGPICLEPARPYGEKI